jgi:hypothetical protein
MHHTQIKRGQDRMIDLWTVILTLAATAIMVCVLLLNVIRKQRAMLSTTEEALEEAEEALEAADALIEKYEKLVERLAYKHTTLGVTDDGSIIEVFETARRASLH